MITNIAAELKERAKEHKNNTNGVHATTNHNTILQRLLNEITPVNLHELIELDEAEQFTQKHMVFGVVKYVLQIAKEHKGNLCKANGATYIYTGELWKQCQKDEIKKFLSEAAVKIGVPEPDAKHYEFTEKLYKQFMSVAHFPIPAAPNEKIMINLGNGTFEFKKDEWELRDFNADDFLTYQLQFDYDPNAPCPMFNKYLEEVLPDEQCRLVLQEFAGYIFTNLNLEKALLLLGTGKNGKSVFMNIICALVGEENTLRYPLGSFNHEYNRAKLAGKLLNYCSEKGSDLSPDIFKALVSGEPLQAREVYQESFTINNKTRIINNLNELPRETELTEAYFRRFLIIPFEVVITEEAKDIELAGKIIANELPGVFNWLLDGLNRILAQRKFSQCEKSDMALKNFKTESDSVQLFINEQYNEFANNNKKKALTELYTTYKNFCADNACKKIGKYKFSQRLEKMGYEKTRLNNGIFFSLKKMV